MKNYLVYSLILLTILALGIVSASTVTVVVGKVYSSDYSSTISGADVQVTCNSHTLSSTSSSDGTFIVGFSTSDCKKGDNVIGSATKGGTTYKVDDVTIEVSSQNIPGSNGGSGSRNHNLGVDYGDYYLCGNGVCNTGETPETCPKDCEKEVIIKEDTNLQLTGNNTNSTESSFLKITGAAAGAIGYIGVEETIGLFIFLILLMIGMLIIRKNYSY